MLRIWQLILIVSCLLPGSSIAEAAREASFTPLGFLLDASSCEGNSLCMSRAWGVSGDGRTVVGDSLGAKGVQSFRWTREEGMVNLGDFPDGPLGSCALGASADASVIVGYGGSEASPSYGEAYRWTAEAGIVNLGDLPGGDVRSKAYAVSADGSVVVGAGDSEGGPEAFRWTADEGMVGLGFLFPGGQSEAYGITADGRVIVGTSTRIPRTFVATRWVDGIGPEQLPPVIGGGGVGELARGVSADGSDIVGRIFPDEAFWWKEEGAVLVGVPWSPVSEALAVSADGSVVVGTAFDGMLRGNAVIWTDEDGGRDLQALLEDELGLNLEGWRLETATGISGDGLTIVGIGVNPDGATEGWVAVLPGSTISVEIDIMPWNDPNLVVPFSRLLIPVALLGSDGFDVANADVTTLAFGPDGAAPAFDLTNPWVYLLSRWDVNGDGKQDLLSYYRTEEAGIAMEDTEACLAGDTLEGTPLEGCDAITTSAGCGHGFQAALVVPPVVWIGGRMRRRRR